VGSDIPQLFLLGLLSLSLRDREALLEDALGEMVHPWSGNLIVRIGSQDFLTTAICRGRSELRREEREGGREAYSRSQSSL
jgi:hypothetical protein